jgi:DNA-directed RNA polymerase subunit RPC12/RpoP
MEKKTKICIDCGKAISRRAIRCHSCSGRVISTGRLHTEEYKRLMSNKQTGKNNSNYIHGKSRKPKFCIDCSQLISWTSTRCKHCAQKGNKNSMFGKMTPHGKWNKYKGYKMRSSWEKYYAKYLDKNNIKWLYESKTFDLGNTTYTPDFYLPETNEYIEIKGYWREDAKIKFNLFKEKYKDLKIRVIDKLSDLGNKLNSNCYRM